MSNIRHLTLSASGMAFDSRTGESFQLNESGRMILQLFQEDQSPEEVARKLSLHFRIPYEQALTDVLEFQIQLQIHTGGVGA